MGLACVQVAKASGLTVYGTAGTQEGIELVLKQGATAAFNHREEGYSKKIMVCGILLMDDLKFYIPFNCISVTSG